jgi:hypothetical protein
MMALAQASAPIMVGETVNIDVYDRPELSGERQIDGGGEVAMPLVGRLPAVGLTAPELEDQITNRLKENGLDSDPHVVVTLSKRLDVYIDGDVNNPGAYPWRPGLTVPQAIALAGGRVVVADDELGPALNALRSIEYAAATQRRAETALVQQARIRSEIAFARAAYGSNAPRDGAEVVDAEALFTMPETLEQTPAMSSFIETQHSIYQHNIRSYTERHASLRTQVGVRQERVSLLQEQLEHVRKETAFVLERMAAFEGLSNKGLITASDMMNMQRVATNSNGTLIEVLAAIADAKVSLEQAELELKTFGLDLKRQLEQGLMEVQADLIDLRARLDPVTRAGFIGAAFDRTSAPGRGAIPVQSGPLVEDKLGAETSVSQAAIQQVNAPAARNVTASVQELVMPGDTITVYADP